METSLDQKRVTITTYITLNALCECIAKQYTISAHQLLSVWHLRHAEREQRFESSYLIKTKYKVYIVLHVWVSFSAVYFCNWVRQKMRFVYIILTRCAQIKSLENHHWFTYLFLNTLGAITLRGASLMIEE